MAVPTSAPLSLQPVDAMNLELTDMAKLSDLVTLIGSFVSGVSIVFAMVLYGHMSHLHSRSNLIFIAGVLGADLLAALTYFSCIFFVPVPTRLSSSAYCEVCGFLMQIYSFCEPAMTALFWLSLFWLMFVGVRGLRSDVVAAVTLSIAVCGVGSSIVALDMNMFERTDNAWCWIRGADDWFRVVFCWMLIAVALLLMALTLMKGLLSSLVNDYEKRLLLRRGTLALAYFVINGVDIAARIWPSDVMTILQAALDPLSGAANVLAFLYSEKMLTIHALGLPPNADPPRGFTAVMKDVPYKANRLQKETSFLLTHNDVAL
jgi:hypothetical protein